MTALSTCMLLLISMQKIRTVTEPVDIGQLTQKALKKK